MLTALLTSLQTSLGQIFSKPFAMGSLLPLLLFLGSCLGLASKLGGAAGRWAASVNPLLGTSANVATAAGSLTVWALAFMGVAVLWSGMSSFLLELLEGKHLGFLARILYAAQMQQIAEIDGKIQEYRRNLRELEQPQAGAAAPQAAHFALKSQLRAARNTGQALQNTTFPRHWWARLYAVARNKPGARDLARVRWRRRTGRVNTLATLTPAVTALSTALRSGTSKPLEYAHVEMVQAIDDSRERLRFEVQRLMNLRQFTYPTVSNANRGETALTVAAPTRLGNLTRTMRSYALDRYGMELDIFWTRLQRVLQKDQAFYSTLSDAKSQVDFLVSLSWLAMVFAVFWSFYCLLVQPAPLEFLLVTAVGPIVARLLYLTTCQNYLVFADLMRSSVDQFRFDLLDNLHMRHPPGNREEVQLWRLLGGWMGYGNDVDVTFKDPT